jgi:hypothetical protein
MRLGVLGAILSNGQPSNAIPRRYIDRERYSSNKSHFLFVLIIKGDKSNCCETRSKRSVEVYRDRNLYHSPPNRNRHLSNDSSQTMTDIAAKSNSMVDIF